MTAELAPTVAQYDDAARRLRRAEMRLTSAKMVANEGVPAGEWLTHQLTLRQQEYLQQQGGRAPVTGLGMTELVWVDGAVRGRVWRTYSDSQRESIRVGQQQSLDAASAAVDRATAALEALARPEILAFVGAREAERRTRALAVEALRRAAQEVDRAKHLWSSARIIASVYVRDIGPDRSTWPEHIKEYVARAEAQVMSQEQYAATLAAAREAFAAVQAVGAEADLAGDRYLLAKRHQRFDR